MPDKNGILTVKESRTMFEATDTAAEIRAERAEKASKHSPTPGPWTPTAGRVRDPRGVRAEVTVRDPRGVLIAEVTDSEAPRETAANGCLIAAAPDLLEALQLCSDFLEANYDARDMPDILYPTRAAIAKAAGGIAP